MEYELIVLVTQGDEMRKKNYEKKLHPTYETSIRVKNTDTTAVVVVKFFDQYRSLSNDLTKFGIGEGLQIHLDAKFPPSQSTSMLGMGMSEDALQQRCYLLNKWMGCMIASYHLFPAPAQAVVAKFLSLDNDDETIEKNKEPILQPIQKKRGEVVPQKEVPKAADNAPSVHSKGANNPTSAAVSNRRTGRLQDATSEKKVGINRLPTGAMQAPVLELKRAGVHLQSNRRESSQLLGRGTPLGLASKMHNLNVNVSGGMKTGLTVDSENEGSSLSVSGPRSGSLSRLKDSHEAIFVCYQVVGHEGIRMFLDPPYKWETVRSTIAMEQKVNPALVSIAYASPCGALMPIASEKSFVLALSSGADARVLLLLTVSLAGGGGRWGVRAWPTLMEPIRPLERKFSSSKPHIPRRGEHAECTLIEYSNFSLLPLPVDQLSQTPNLLLMRSRHYTHQVYSSEASLYPPIVIFIENICEALGMEFHILFNMSLAGIAPDICILTCGGRLVGVLEIKAPHSLMTSKGGNAVEGEAVEEYNAVECLPPSAVRLNADPSQEEQHKIPIESSGKQAVVVVEGDCDDGHILRNPFVAGQMFDQMLLIEAFYCSGPILGILSTYDSWRVCWLPTDHSTFTKDPAELVKSSQEPVLATPAKAARGEAEEDLPLTPDTESRAKGWVHGLSVADPGGEQLDWPADPEDPEAGRPAPGATHTTPQEHQRVMHCSPIIPVAEYELLLQYLCTALHHMNQVVPNISQVTRPPRCFMQLRKRNAADAEDLNIPSITFVQADVTCFKNGNYTKFKTCTFPPSTTKYLLALEDLGRGSSGHCWLLATNPGVNTEKCKYYQPSFCVAKFASSTSTTLSRIDERNVWHIAYPELSKMVRVEVWGGAECLVMPHICPLPKLGKEQWLHSIRRVLKERFHLRGIVHADVKWDNIGYYKKLGCDEVVVFDLEKVGKVPEGGSDDWIDRAIQYLKKTI